jgi:hypothetical protein
MLGVTPVCAWTRPVDQGLGGRVEARTLDGRIIGAAEAECLRSESTWKSRDDYALRSMAQTRATSKALGSVLRFVVTLAGYSGTPAEEMPGEKQEAQAPTPAQPAGPELGAEQVERIVSGIKALGLSYDDLALVFGAVGAEAQSINRPDSVAKALRTLTPEQADAMETELDRRAVANG